MTDANAAAGLPSPAGANAGPAVVAPTPAAGSAQTLPTDPQEAQAMHAALMKDAGFRRDYASTDPRVHGGPRAYMAKLIQAAHPDGAPPAPKEGTPEAARARIAELRSDHAFIRRYNEGGAVERAEMARLHAEAYPADADAGSKPPDGQTGGGTDAPPYPLNFRDGTDAAHVTAAQREAGEIVKALELDADTAHGAISVIEQSHAKRTGPDGAPRAMDADEITLFEATLRGRWGADYDANCDAVERAFSRMGASRAEWVRRSLEACDPVTAAGMFLQLAARGAKGA